MNHLYWLVALFLASVKLAAADIGLYDISDPSHPKLLKDQIGKTSIYSVSNDNKGYMLNIDALHSFSLPCSRIGLIVGETMIRFNDQGLDSSGQYASMATAITNPEIVPSIAKYLHAKVLKRRHPGNRMLVEFIPSKAEFSVGDPLIVTLRITNIGDTEFAFFDGGRQRGPRNNQFAFSAELIGGMMVPDIGNPQNFGGLMTRVLLKPGKSYDVQVDLASWFNFQKDESYHIRGSYQMRFIDPKTNDGYRMWEDYACAEFTVIMKN